MKKYAAWGLVVFTIATSVVGWFALPETVAVQIGLDGKASSTMPKLAALLIPVLISCAGAVMSSYAGEKKRNKAIVVSIAGAVVAIITVLFNI